MDYPPLRPDMDCLNAKCDQRPVAESWEMLESYFTCISECSMNDHECVSNCPDQHLNSNDGMSPSLASFLSGPANRNGFLTQTP